MGESFFHTNALFREKIFPWTCAGNLLASSQAALYTQELNLEYLGDGDTWFFQVAVLNEVYMFLGSDLKFTSREMSHQKSVSRKRKRGTTQCYEQSERRDAGTGKRKPESPPQTM